MSINYIRPGSEVDLTIAALRSAIDHVQHAKYLMSLIDNAKPPTPGCKNLVGIVREEIKKLDKYLEDIEQQAKKMATIASNDDEEFVRLMDRLGGFA